MNKVFVLSVLLVMFLSCGNSNPVASEKKFVVPKQAVIDLTLSKEQKLIAYKLDTMFTRLNKAGAFNGSILIAKSGAVLYRKNIGVADKENNVGLTDSSMFQLASVSKVITATAVLMLYERELIDLNKTFASYFPDFPYTDVTVKQLLNHRSGLPNYIYALNTEIYQPNYKMSNSDMYSYLKVKNPKAYLKPDAKFNYCNTNYALLALLVEKISGKPFSQFLKDELFSPLGMKNTATIRDLNMLDSKVTKPYDLKWKPVEFDASDYVLGDKSVYSTTYDLFLFSEAMYQNKILKPETQELAYTSFSKEKKLSNYGLGWRIKDLEETGKKEVFHNGWWHGYRSSFHRRLSDTLTVVILSNQLNKAVYHTYKVYQIIDNVGGTETEGEDE